MSENLLFQFLRKENSNHKIDKYLNYLHFDLCYKIYSYGEHFKYPSESKANHLLKVKKWLYNIKIIRYYFSLILLTNKKHPSENIILSTAYFNLENLNLGQNFPIKNAPWVSLDASNRSSFLLFIKGQDLARRISEAKFSELLDEQLFNKIDDYKEALKEYVQSNPIRALFLAQDLGLFEKIAIEVFKELRLPTFNFIHGFPAIYNGIDNNRTDYIVVWGDEIKNNFTRAGYQENKIIVNGHPKYKKLNIKPLKFSFEDVLIVSKSLIGSQYSDEIILGDRSNLIFYLLSIQEVLEKFNIKKVRFRPHPSENINWYYKFIDKNFFQPDIIDASDSLLKSTLVIGGTSTMFFESIIHGVNYVVFEPKDANDKLIDGFIPISPFDGKNIKVPVAKSSSELLSILEHKLKVENSVLYDFIDKDFNQQIILEKIVNHCNSYSNQIQ